MKHAWIVFFGVMVGTVCAFLLAAFVVGEPIVDSFVSAHGVLIESGKSKLCIKETALLSKMISDGSVLPVDNILSTTIAYYQSVIDTLIAILAILGFVAYMYVRSVSIRAAEKMAEKAVKNYLATQAFVELANKIFSSKFDDGMKAFSADIEKISERAKKLEKRLDDFDTGPVLDKEEIEAGSLEISPESPTDKKE